MRPYLQVQPAEFVTRAGKGGQLMYVCMFVCYVEDK